MSATHQVSTGRDLLDDCVHCGFCLPTCPTYLLWGQETDSPRGRIHLMKLRRDGREADSAGFVRHIDTCLGCMACVTACPSGVQYDSLLEAARPQVERDAKRGVWDRAFRRLIFAMFPHPGRLRALSVPLGLYQKLGIQRLVHASGVLALLPKRLQAMERLLPPITFGGADLPARIPAQGPQRKRVALLLGCVQRVFFRHVNEATARVLAAEGCEVIVPQGQACCGALAEHAGEEADAMAAAQKAHRRIRRRRCRYDCHQCCRLRVCDEAIRAPASQRCGVRRESQGVRCEVQGHFRSPGRARAARAPGRLFD